MRRLSNNTLNENSTEGTLCELIKKQSMKGIVIIYFTTD